MGDREKQKLDLNTVQVIASMGAAVTGAVLTSYLGDGGTIVGTAVGSGASTAGFAVYKHYLARTQQKVAPVIVGHARQWSPITQPSGKRGASGGPAGAGQAGAGPAGAGRAGAGPAASAGRTADTGQGTRAGQPAPTLPAHTWDPGTPDARPWGHTPDSRTGVDGTAADPGRTYPDGGRWTPGDDRTRDIRRPDWFGGPGSSDPGSSDPGSSGAGGGAGRHGRDGSAGSPGGQHGRPRWLIMVASTAAVFLAALLFITLVEFGTGKPISASVWGQKASGTTLGNVTGHTGSGTVTPTVNPSATPSGTVTPGLGQTADPSPTSSATTAPTPSSVPSVSTTPGRTEPTQVQTGTGTGTGTGGGQNGQPQNVPTTPAH